ncbi:MULTISPECIES: hypothetical protein [Zobellia]|nr:MULTISPECIES: hypothetical protein [Zobellia]MDO6517581.1 hypothetical protein [Zobellia uliginosa]
MKYDFTDWLSASLKLGFTKYAYEYKEEHGGLSYAFELPNTYARIDEFNPSTYDAMLNSSRFNSDFIINIDKDLSESFSINANLGHNIRITDSKTINVEGLNLIIPDFYNVSTRTGEL